MVTPPGQNEDSPTTGCSRSSEPLSDDRVPLLVEVRPCNSNVLDLRYRSVRNYQIPKVQPYQEVPRVVDVGACISRNPNSGENNNDNHSLTECDAYPMNTKKILHSIKENSLHAENAVESSESCHKCLVKNSLDIHSVSQCEDFPVALALDMHPTQACPRQSIHSKVGGEDPGISAAQACSNMVEDGVDKTSATPCRGLDSPISSSKRVVHWGNIPSGTFPHGQTSQLTDSLGRSQSLGSVLDYSRISKWLREIMKTPETYSPKLTQFPTRSYSNTLDSSDNGRVSRTLPQATNISRRDTGKSAPSVE